MSDFDRRWRRLARAASRAAEAPLPPAPDGARLMRRAAAAAGEQPLPRPFRLSLANAVALALLWALALPNLRPALRTAGEMLNRIALSTPDSARRLSLPPAQLPTTPAAPALASPRLPPLPDLWPRLRLADPPAAAHKKETPS